ncbi:MAG: tryptophan synthase subunit alpha [Lachnospiraceae bacterium]|nr:tryptophan synthase subunit alpha [Lachnospiraceae bacterium]
MNRIEEKMQELTARGEKALITYVTAGLPNLTRTGELIRAQEAAGIDVIELGIPFSDPIADGPVIQNASFQSIQNGTTLRKVFVLMEELRAGGCEVPIVFMMYYNTILHYGVQAFADKCAAAGVDGLIVPDLPLEEQGELQEALAGREETILLQLVSPVSGERIPKILEQARGYVYCVSAMGVTGQGGNFHKNIKNYLESVRAQSKIPVMMGFGIRTAADIEPLRDSLDGAIVGSYFIQLLEKNDFRPETAAEYVRGFKADMEAWGA